MIQLHQHCWEIALAKVRTLGLIFMHCNTICAPFTIYYLAVFYCSHYKNSYLLSILHFYHHLFAKLVHLYKLPLYLVCWGHKRLFIIWLWGCLRDTIFSLCLPQIDKPQVIHLRENCYCPTKLCTWRPNNVYKKKGCIVDIKLFSGAVVREAR